MTLLTLNSHIFVLFIFLINSAKLPWQFYLRLLFITKFTKIFGHAPFPLAPTRMNSRLNSIESRTVSIEIDVGFFGDSSAWMTKCVRSSRFT